jgi:nitroreductase
MDFETVVKRRRMCREFLERDVPQEKIDPAILLLGTRSHRSSLWCITGG